jgi:hypothetical protein
MSIWRSLDDTDITRDLRHVQEPTRFYTSQSLRSDAGLSKILVPALKDWYGSRDHEGLRRIPDDLT